MNAHSRRTLVRAAAPLAVLLGAACSGATTSYVPRDPMLRGSPLYYYRPRGGVTPRALLFFFGNDVAFWEAHQRLAERLAARGYDVVGFDVRRYFYTVSDTGAARTARVASDIDTLLAHVRRELGDTRIPVVLGGHSLGADQAAWVAANAPPPGLIGVLMVSPTARSHLYATFEDRANLGESTEPGSFSAAELVRRLRRAVRVAVIRGGHDPYRSSDSAILAAGAGHVTYSNVPFAGHSMHSLIIAAPIIGRALDRITDGASAAGAVAPVGGTTP